MKRFFLLVLLVLAGCSDNERAGNGGGSATITIDGEPYTVETVRCGTGPEDYRITVDGSEYSFVQVRFPDFRDPQFDNGLVIYDPGEKETHFEANSVRSRRTNQTDEVNITGSANHATGSAVMYERPFNQSDRGTSVTIQLDIRCPG